MNSTELQEIFSSNLKNARARANLSQINLAVKANLSVSYICDLESGRRWGTPETFAKLSSALNINPFELLLPRPLSSDEDNIANRRELLAHLSDSVRENVLSAVNKAISETFSLENIF